MIPESGTINRVSMRPGHGVNFVGEAANRSAMVVPWKAKEAAELVKYTIREGIISLDDH